ncbi:MAG: hypothetical protein HXY23_03930 [Parvularculaceae bacterium]|jgi:hypothetical protein|nr:hypothetical protein [Parvularculaceae bacterium]
MGRLILVAAAAALAAALFLRAERAAEPAQPKSAAETTCEAEELCLVSIF